MNLIPPNNYLPQIRMLIRSVNASVHDECELSKLRGLKCSRFANLSTSIKNQDTREHPNAQSYSPHQKVKYPPPWLHFHTAMAKHPGSLL